MSRNVELESAIKYTISNPTRYNGFLRVAANNFRLSTANQLFVYYQKEDARRRALGKTLRTYSCG